MGYAGGGDMIKLHATRLMPSGEIVLWREGAIVSSGAVGAYVRDVAFDTVSMHIDDSAMMATRVSNRDRPTPKRCSRRLPIWGARRAEFLASIPDVDPIIQEVRHALDRLGISGCAARLDAIAEASRRLFLRGCDPA